MLETVVAVWATIWNWVDGHWWLLLGVWGFVYLANLQDKITKARSDIEEIRNLLRDSVRLQAEAVDSAKSAHESSW